MRRALFALLLFGCGSNGGGGGDAAAPSDGKQTFGMVDSCFEPLRALRGAFQDATHRSADGRYVLRLALETADRGGTSGSYGWAAIRVGLETPEGLYCRDENLLAGAYKGSHHNCMDTLTIEAGGLRYTFLNPDSAADYGDKTRWRREATLTISGGMSSAPIRMPTVKCNKTDRADGACSSGGPCQ